MKYLYRLLLVTLLFAGHSVFSQRDTNHTPKANLSSPVKAFQTLFDNQQDDRYYPEVAAEAIYQGGYSLEQRKKLAVKIKQIYDGAGIYLYPDLMPTNTKYMDSVTHKHIYVLSSQLPNFYLKLDGNQWRFSETSTRAVESKHKEIYKYGTHALLNWLSGFDHDRYLGLYAWQLIGIFVISLLAFLLHKFLSFIFKKVIIGLILRFAHARLAGKYIGPVARPLSLLIVFYFISIFVPILLLNHPKGEAYVIGAIKILLPFFAMVVFYKLVDVLIAYLRKLAERTESTLDDQLVPLLSKALKVFVVAVGVLFILDNFNFNITALITGLGIGGFALALAAQDMLKNFFGSIMIFMDRPFQVGDWVVGDGIDGDIEEVGFRATRIRTFHNSLTYVPNGILADMTIDNMGMRKYRRYKTYLAVTYDTPPDVLEAYVSGLRKIVDNHPSTRKDYYNIFVNTFNSSSIDILFYVFFEVPTWPEELKARHELNLLAIKLAEELGVRFAFPTQTIHIEDMPGQLPKTPTYKDEKSEIDKKVDKFISGEFENTKK